MEIAIFKSDLWHNHVKKKIKVAKKEDPQPGIRRKKITSNRGRINKKKCRKRYQEPALRRRVLIQTENPKRNGNIYQEKKKT